MATSVLDLENHLREQLQFLEASAVAYDGGFEGEAKRLAVAIRMLVHDTNRSTSLLTQLGVKLKMRFVDTAAHEPPGAVVIGNSGLAIQRIQTGRGGEGRYVAPLDNLPPNRQNPPASFKEWWERPVLTDVADTEFSRKRLVLTTANKAGGAHVHLESLAGTDGARAIQVAYSTHSPYFSRPALFADLRLFRRLADGGTSCVAADPEAITEAIEAVKYGKDVGENVEKALADSLREAIFARAVLLCEGETDAAVLEGIAETQGGLDSEGVAVAPCGSKANVIIAIAILRQLEIPFLALFDGDANGQDSAQAKRNRQILELCGEDPTDWPERGLRNSCANFTDRIETDLASIWPSFGEACEQVGGELGVTPDKNPRVYRRAAAEAGEPPDFLLDVLDAARSATE